MTRRTGGTGPACAAAVLAASLAWAAAERAGTAMELPDGVEWTRISEQRQGASYQREWVPSGSGPEDAVWLIVEQRLELAGPTTAAAALATIHGSSRNACTAVRFEGPEAIEGGGQGVAGRIYCAHQHGRPHGTVTDQRIHVEGRTMHVVTSELRTPPSPVPGVFPFDSEEESAAFMARLARSAEFVRQPVRIATPRPPAVPEREE